MPILSADALSKAFGTRTLFRNASFAIEVGEKLGFIGPNGSGKSTLFQILAGQEPPDGGRVAIGRDATVGLLPQEPEFDPEMTIRTAAASGNPDRAAAFQSYNDLTSAIADVPTGPRHDALLEQQSRAMAEIERLGGWSWQHELEELLTRLGIPEWDRKMGPLSGGERKRVALARALISRPDVLLLDEPTNHLDADTTLWLEERLLDFPGAVLLITHDRYFLDRVVDRMIEVHPDHFQSFEGGYTEYLAARAERAEQQRVADEKRDKLLDQELAWIRRSPSARTGKQKARIKRAEILRDEKRTDSSRDVEIHFGEPPRLGRTVVDLHDVDLTLGDRLLIRDLTVQIRAGERIGVIGPNGAGKTTLLRLLIGELSPDSGSVTLGKNTEIAYFDQKRLDLDPDTSVLDAVGEGDWVEMNGNRIHRRSYLERFLFPTSTHQLRVGSLSGGERNRLLLARLLLNQANLLILDEPTNDLDLDTLRILESALVDFGGSALVVTHDRYFLDKVATGLLVFEGDGRVHRHEGGYDLYRRLLESRPHEPSPAPRKSATAPPREPSRAKKLSYREKQELEGIEQTILEAEERRDALGSQLSDPQLYVETPEKVAALREEFSQAEESVARLYNRWEELERISEGG